jgi:AraC-like DNA-binding protein
VDLAGRLSNPPEAIETLAEQGFRASQTARPRSQEQRNGPSEGSSNADRDQRGRLSNPIQRRLSEATVDDVVRDYLAGSSIESLAAQLQVNRTTIISHLERRGIERRRILRKMTDRTVREAASLYHEGQSLKTVAARLGVDARTLAREFRAAAHPYAHAEAGPDSCDPTSQHPRLDAQRATTVKCPTSP